MSPPPARPAGWHGGCTWIRLPRPRERAHANVAATLLGCPGALRRAPHPSCARLAERALRAARWQRGRSPGRRGDGNAALRRRARAPGARARPAAGLRRPLRGGADPGRGFARRPDLPQQRLPQRRRPRVASRTARARARRLAAIARARRAQCAPSLRRRQRLLRALARRAHGLHLRLLPCARALPRRGAAREARPGMPKAPAPAGPVRARARLGLGRAGAPHGARVRRARARLQRLPGAGGLGARARGEGRASRRASSSCWTTTATRAAATTRSPRSACSSTSGPGTTRSSGA